MLRFALVAIILVIINISAIDSYLPQAVTFGKNLERFYNCLLTGVNPDTLYDGGQMVTLKDTRLNATIAHCGDPADIAPGVGLLYGLAASQSLPALFFGIIFAVPSLKQLRLALKNKLSSVAPTSSMAGSSSSGSQSKRG